MAHHLIIHVSTPPHVSFPIHYSLLILQTQVTSIHTHDQILISSYPPQKPHKSLKNMVKFGNMRSVKRPGCPSLLIWMMFLILICSCVTNTKGSSRGVSKTQFFKTMRPQILPHKVKYVYDGATVKGFLPKALPIPPSGPSHHHNSIGINTMHP